MKLEEATEGRPVLYIPKHLLKESGDKQILTENLGIIKGVVSNTCVFVQYRDDQAASQSTHPMDLYTIHYRPDVVLKAALKFHIDDISQFMHDHCDPKALQQWRLVNDFPSI